MKVLLLGATGLLGHNVLVRLLDGGHSVVAAVRDASRLRLPARWSDDPSLTVLTTTGSALPALPPVDAIVNCAGTTDMSLLRYEDYLPGNKMLVEQLLQLMDDAHIGTLVHVSTANTVGYGTAERPGDEERPMCGPFASSFYARSKREGERLMEWAALEHPERHLVILNPGFMVGAYDTKPSSGKLLLAAYRRRMMAVPRGGKSFVHVADVADAVVGALTRGRNGERYLLTGEEMTLKAFYELQAEVCGYRQRLVVLPNWAVRVAGGVGDLLRRLHIATQLSTNNVRQLLVVEHYSSDKARRELGFGQTPVATAIGDFFDWRGGSEPGMKKNTTFVN